METESKSSTFTSVSQGLKNNFTGTGFAISCFGGVPEDSSYSKCRQFLSSHSLNVEGGDYYTLNISNKENLCNMNSKENTPEGGSFQTTKRKLLFRRINAILEDAPDRNSILDKLFEAVDALDPNMFPNEIGETSKDTRTSPTMQTEDKSSISEASMEVNITTDQEDSDAELPNNQVEQEKKQNKILDNPPENPETTKSPFVSGLGDTTQTETTNKPSVSGLRSNTQAETAVRRSSRVRTARKSGLEYLQCCYLLPGEEELSADLRKKKRKRVAGKALNVGAKRRKLFTMDAWMTCMPEETGNGT